MNTGATVHVISDTGLFKLRVATPVRPKPIDTKTTQGGDSSVGQSGY